MYNVAGIIFEGICQYMKCVYTNVPGHIVDCTLAYIYIGRYLLDTIHLSTYLIYQSICASIYLSIALSICSNVIILW